MNPKTNQPQTNQPQQLNQPQVTSPNNQSMSQQANSMQQPQAGGSNLPNTGAVNDNGGVESQGDFEQKMQESLAQIPQSDLNSPSQANLDAANVSEPANIGADTPQVPNFDLQQPNDNTTGDVSELNSPNIDAPANDTGGANQNPTPELSNENNIQNPNPIDNMLNSNSQEDVSMSAPAQPAMATSENKPQKPNMLGMILQIVNIVLVIIVLVMLIIK